MADVLIGTLGHLTVEGPDGDARPTGRKASAMLGVLALAQGRAMSREYLSSLLWSDRGQDQARASLRQALAELRAALPAHAQAMVIGRDSVAVAGEHVTTDVARIIRACAEETGSELADRLSRVDGPLLAGYDGLSPAFDQWLRVERTRHHEELVTAVLARATAMVKNGDVADIGAILRGLEVLDPGNEVVARLGMQADHLAGDLASLHRRYRRLTDDLQREFGAKPSEETRDLFYRLTTTVAAAPAAEAPADIAPTPAAHGPSRTPPIVMVAPITATGDQALQEIAAIASDDIQVALGRHGDVRVVMLEGLDPERVEHVGGQALDAYLLSGRLREVDGETRCSVQLGNVRSRLVAWSEQIRIDHRSLSQAVDGIVARAVGAVVPAIDRDFGATMRQRRPGADDAVELYARGRYLIRSVRNLGAVRDGMMLLDRAIVLDPAHVGARLLLAQLYNTDLWQQVTGHDVGAYRVRALSLIQEAAALEPENARIQMKLAWCYLRRREWDSCERRLTTALERSPYDADAINEGALAWLQLGDLDRAGELMQHAFALNPFPPADYHADYALLCAMNGDAAAAEEHFEASGETRLQYVATRLANLSDRPAAGDPRRVLRDDFRTRFEAAWTGADRPGTAEMIDWLDQTYIFRRADHRFFWRDRLTAALA